jgi:glycosyltransferase involved in cell wall biosynthesis
MRHIYQVPQRVFHAILSYAVWLGFIVVDFFLSIVPAQLKPSIPSLASQGYTSQFGASSFVNHATMGSISEVGLSDLQAQVQVHALNKPLRVMMLGLRGFPNVQGGVEVHAQNLAPLLANIGCEVEVIVRSPYQNPLTEKIWDGVNFTKIWSPKSKGLEAVLHTFIGVMYAAIKRPDVLHIHAIGPALMTPLARLLGLRVVVTHHGPDYKRQKWGRFARSVLKLGEWCGMRFSNGRIVISDVIRKLVMDKYHAKSELIYNGVNIPVQGAHESTLEQLGLKKGRYVLMVTRLVPEKRHLDLIQAFLLANIPDYKLVIVGKSDHPDHYVQQLLKIAAEQPNVIMAGFHSGETLHALYTYAGIFVLPSSHEGLSISLLEALSYGVPVIASDIPANTELGLSEASYFPIGDVEKLADRIRAYVDAPLPENERMQIRMWVEKLYNWDRIAYNTYLTYLRVATNS